MYSRPCYMCPPHVFPCSARDLNIGCSVTAEGDLVESTHPLQRVEMQVKGLEVLGDCDPTVRPYKPTNQKLRRFDVFDNRIIPSSRKSCIPMTTSGDSPTSELTPITSPASFGPGMPLPWPFTSFSAGVASSTATPPSCRPVTVRVQERCSKLR